MSSVRRSIFLSLADNYLGMALQLSASLIVARLLTPTEIGIFAVAAVVAALASAFRDFGVSEYLIQESELTCNKIRSALAVNIGVSWLMAVLLFGTSSAVGNFYGEEGVAQVMRIQSLNFLLVPFGAVSMAYHRRELNYQPILIVGLGSNITAFVASTVLAWFGFSYLALAWSSLASITVTVGLSLFFRPKGFPSLPGLKEIRSVLHFGKHVSGIYLFGQIGKNAPEAVIGRVLDMASVAFYSRGNGLMELFNRTVLKAVTPICLPYFSQSIREGSSVREGYLKAVILITGIGWSFFAFVGISAYSIVRLLYGPQWMPSVALAQVLCVAAIVQLPYHLANEVLIAIGRVDQCNKLQFLVQSIRLASLTLVFPFGLIGVCWGLVAGALLGGLVAQRILRFHIGLRFRELARSCATSLLTALTTLIPITILTLTIEQNKETFIPFLIGGGLITFFSWLASLKTWRHPFWTEISNMLRNIRSSRIWHH
jgi:O-antigen/teichoic acid export membrane protein